MLLGSRQWVRSLQLVFRASLGCLVLVSSGCDNSPIPDARTDDLRVGEEVFRMFCMRVARRSYPNEPSGQRFVPLCEGKTEDIPKDLKDAKLTALIERRPETVAALDQVLGDAAVQDSQTFEDDQLEAWLLKLLPFYQDAEDETLPGILPRSTRALSKVMERLTDDKDQNAKEVLATIARISKRTGYRSPDRVLAAIRPTLKYDRIDELTDVLLGLVAEGGDGHDAFMGVLEATALELAEPAEDKDGPTTLSLALDLVLRPTENDLFVKAEGKTLEPLLVLERDDEGNAIAEGDDAPTPFLVAGRDDGDTDRDADTKLAMSGGRPAYKTFDANQTALASMMRDGISLIRRGSEERSTVEKLLRSARPLLGKNIERTETFGGKSLTYTGPDIEHGPMSNFLHAITTLLKLPETEAMLDVVNQLIQKDEKSATELIYAALKIDEQSDKPGFNGGKLTPNNEFWDDLIAFGLRMVKERPGLWADVLAATLTPETVATGTVLAHQMQNKDLVKLASEDINSDVTTGCPVGDGMPAYCVPVDRTMPDKGMNRSIFQRTLSLVHGTYGVVDGKYLAPNCNKEGAVLTVLNPIETSFPNPPLGPLAPLLGAFGGGSGDCPTSTVAPPPATSYKRCQLIEQKSGAVTLMRAMLKKGKIIIKDDEVSKCATAIGLKVAEAQEAESGIKGFNLSPEVKPLGRFVYAKRNKFITDMFDPLPTVDGVSVNDFEPNGMYTLEVTDPEALIEGKPQSFLTATIPLLDAFDKHDTIDANGDPVGSYFFAELLDLVHMHYSSQKPEACPDAVLKDGGEGCTQTVDPAAKFYSHGSNIVSYEPLIIWSLLDQNLLGVLSRSTAALKGITAADGRDGVAVLDSFIQALLVPNPAVKYRDGRAYAKTNTCVVEGTGADMTCKDGKGRVIKDGVPPVYLLLDALNELDTMWQGNKEQHDLYLGVRSTLVDKYLGVGKAADGATSFQNRRAYALTSRGIPWILARMADHKADRAEWADGLVDRIATVLAHPIAARGMDLFDQFWENTAAGDEVAKLLTYLVDEDENPEAFTGAVVALADTLTFLNKDPDLTPAIRFAALGLAQNAIDVVESGEGEPDITEGTAYRFLEVTREIAKVDEGDELSTIAKLLRNMVLPIASSEQPELDGKSPLEVFIDVVAEVNREDPTEDSTVTLSAEDDKLVFEELSQFLTSEEIGLERLYKVIENRNIQ